MVKIKDLKAKNAVFYCRKSKLSCVKSLTMLECSFYKVSIIFIMIDK